MHARVTIASFAALTLVSALSAAQGDKAAAPAPPAPPALGSEAHYEIRAAVDDSKRLDGALSLRWVNRSGEAVSDLWFHLHLNAFSNTHSTHMLEAGGELRGVPLDSGFGYQEVTKLTVGGVDVLPTRAFVVTEDGRESDRTVFKVDLPQAVPPGGVALVDIEWHSQLPRVRRRTGVHEDFIFLAHWFPKLGVYEAGRGWNCHQFHANTEFYADYGTYSVTLDLPERYSVSEDGGRVFKGGATGVQVDRPKLVNGRVVVRFEAPSRADRDYLDPTITDGSGRRPLVHGFTWTADPAYLVRRRTFKYEEWAARFETEVQAAAIAFRKSPSELRLRDVEVTVLIQPEREAQWERHFEATAAALFFYGLWWGEYPYEHLTVVDPAWGADEAGGMEYPTLFTCGTKLFTSPAMYEPESVTVHEAGHQFWYGLVGNNEYEAAWLDEGLNSYTDSEVLHRVYGPRREATWYAGLPQWGRALFPASGGGDVVSALAGERWTLPLPEALGWRDELVLQPLELPAFVSWWRDQPRLTFLEQYDDVRWSDRARYLLDPDSDPIDRKGFQYVDRLSYSINSYPRPAVALRSLPAVVGADAFRRGMRHYADVWRYRHAYPDDFFAAFQAGAEVDVQWYFDEVFRGTATVDWRVDVEEREVQELVGLVRGEDGTWSEAGVPAELEEAAEPTDAAESDAGALDDAAESDQGAGSGGDAGSDADSGSDEGAGSGAENGSDGAAGSGGDAGLDGDNGSDGDAGAGEPVGSSGGTGSSSGEGAGPDGGADSGAPTPALRDGRSADGVTRPRTPGTASRRQSTPEEAPNVEEAPVYLRDVVVRRSGALLLPVDVEVRFDDETRVRMTWTREAQASSAWWRLPLEPGTARITAVLVDPDRQYFLDADMSNNQWFRPEPTVRPMRFGERAFTRAATLLHWAASIGG